MSEHIPLDELSARIDQDELSNARLLQIDAHLAGCEDCRIQLESLRWAASFSRSLPMALPPASFELRLPSQSIEAEPEAAADSDFESEAAWWRSGAWQGLAALAAMLILALMMGRLSPSLSTLSDSAGAPAGFALQESGMSSDEMAETDFAEEASDFEEAGEAPQALAIGSAADSSAAQADAVGPDMDGAADHAQLRSEDSADAVDLIPPLATAIGEDGRRRVLRAGTEAVPADRPEGDGTAAAVASELGGYSPPDRPIPGAAVARDRAPLAVATEAPGSRLAMVSTPTTEAPAAIADASEAEAPSETEHEAADAAIAEDAGVADEAASPSLIEGSPNLDSSMAEAPLSEPSPAEQLAPAPEAQPPATSATAPRSLLVPLAAVSFGLLALATLLLRRAGQERSRRRHRQR
jgi:hypothetical protein